MNPENGQLFKLLAIMKINGSQMQKKNNCITHFNTGQKAFPEKKTANQDKTTSNAIDLQITMR